MVYLARRANFQAIIVFVLMHMTALSLGTILYAHALPGSFCQRDLVT
jgi:hypothetical protein